MFEAEAEIKRANMSSLIRIKNALTQEQRDKLTALRRPRFRVGSEPVWSPGLTVAPLIEGSRVIGGARRE